MKSSKRNLRFCRLDLGPILSPTFIYPPVVSTTENLALIEPIQEVQNNYTIATKNEEILLEVNAEEVEPMLETQTNIARNPNIRNDVDYHSMKWL